MTSSGVDPTTGILEYARETATEDVRATLAWLDGHGFQLQRAIGGRAESFGNLLVQFGGDDDITVEIVRDRSQWSCQIGTLDLSLHPLNVWITAMDDEPPRIPPRSIGDPLPDQLPDGLNWATAVPRIIEWLTAASDRREAVERASKQWRAAMKQWWKQQERE